MLEPGQIFAARYRVDRRIAEGGMGAIFEAEHTATERRVALKLLFPHIMSVASARKKFELEAKISARVNSPNIVEVLDAGFDEATQSPFLVMELLEGQTLAQHVRARGPLSADQVLPLLAQVAAGLDAAHGYREANGTHKPIVHRDLKPENLFIAREHGVQRVKILDFGIAKVLGETGNVSQEVRGTPLYMAFEQVTAGALSPQTDVWALGLITYFMLTASHYWRSASAPSANVQSLFAEILSLPLEPPSVRSRQQHVNVELPPAFDAWLLECIDRDPGRRFASAGLAIDALAQAFGKNPRSRPRVDSKPARSLGLAVTEAFQAPTPALLKPLGTAASLPGITSERGSSLAPPLAAGPRPWRAAVAAGAVLLLGGTGWLVLGQREPTAAPHAAPTLPTAETVTAPTPGVSAAPAAAPVSRSPTVAPANDEPALDPSATAEAATLCRLPRRSRCPPPRWRARAKRLAPRARRAARSRRSAWHHATSRRRQRARRRRQPDPYPRQRSQPRPTARRGLRRARLPSPRRRNRLLQHRLLQHRPDARRARRPSRHPQRPSRHPQRLSRRPQHPPALPPRSGNRRAPARRTRCAESALARMHRFNAKR